MSDQRRPVVKFGEVLPNQQVREFYDPSGELARALCRKPEPGDVVRVRFRAGLEAAEVFTVFCQIAAEASNI